MTMPGALRQACSWSQPFQDQRCAESAARANINGCVKLYIKGTIVKNFGDQELNRILLVAGQYFVNENLTSIEQIVADLHVETFLSKMTPIILKYIQAKVKLLVKHIIAPNFAHHDLRIKFSSQGLEVEIEGYVYAHQFRNVNQIIAENPQVRFLPDVVESVLLQQAVLPTTTLHWQEISVNYKVDEVRARSIVKVAKEKQEGECCFPLSLLDIWTPEGTIPSDKEQTLRAKILKLSNEKGAGEDVVEAIATFADMVLEEGLFEEVITEGVERNILQSMKAKLIELNPELPSTVLNALTWYHTLLFRTGGSNQWTLRRKCGETKVVPYHPLLLEALKERVEVRTALTAEHLEAEEYNFAPPLQERALINPAWTNISVLKFVSGVFGENYKEMMSQSSVALKTSQDQERCFRESTERDEEIDDIFLNRKDESFIIINGDLRKLYAKRPHRLAKLTFAQFVLLYYKKKPHHKAIVYPGSDIGEESDVPIVGGETNAPVCMKLSNGIIMKKRSEKNLPVPLLSPSNTLDKFGERMLFRPWRTLEELLHEDTEEEQRQLMENRLALFPMSQFILDR